MRERICKGAALALAAALAGCGGGDGGSSVPVKTDSGTTSVSATAARGDLLGHSLAEALSTADIASRLARFGSVGA